MSGVSNPSIVIVEYGFPIFFIVRLLNELPPLISMFLGPKFPSDSMTMLSAEFFLREIDDERRFVVPENMLMSPLAEMLERDISLSLVEMFRFCFISTFFISVVPSTGERDLLISMFLAALSFMLML